MIPRTLAHLSDLHIGSSEQAAIAAGRLCRALLDSQVDHVVVTGDMTHRGRRRDMERFFQIFAPLQSSGRFTVIPGNHDRNTEDAGEWLMRGERVQVEQRRGLYLIKIDSTGPQCRAVIGSHGSLCKAVLQQVETALGRAPRGAIVAALLHHHLLPLPLETIGEWFADKFGWPHAEELELGRELLQMLRGRCDLVLHGHRHVPREFRFDDDSSRPMTIYNAGSSTELGGARLFRHAEGRLVSEPTWLSADERLKALQPVPIPAAFHQAWANAVRPVQTHGPLGTQLA